jgi:hypothetical protein
MQGRRLQALQVALRELSHNNSDVKTHKLPFFSNEPSSPSLPHEPDETQTNVVDSFIRPCFVPLSSPWCTFVASFLFIRSLLDPRSFSCDKFVDSLLDVVGGGAW